MLVRPARGAQCHTVSGQVFEAPAQDGDRFFMAVRGCAAPAQGLKAAPVAAIKAPAEAPKPLSPMLRLFEARDARAEIRMPAEALPATLAPRPAPPVRSRAALSKYSVYESMMASVGDAYRIDPAFLAAVVNVESRANPAARSPKGALGLMQVTPATARRFGVATAAELSDPAANLRVGAAYLKQLQRLYGNNLPLVLAAYNAGEGAVERHGRRTPPYPETVGYIARVLDRYRTALAVRDALSAGGQP